MAKINPTAEPRNMRLPDLILLLEKPELTPQEREAIRKYMTRIDSMFSISGGGAGYGIWQYIKLKNEIWRWAADGRDIDTFPNSHTGLEDALATASAGDKIVLPQDIAVESALTIPASVHVMGLSKDQTELTIGGVDSGAMITLGAAAVLSNLSITAERENYASLFATAANAAIEDIDVTYSVSDTTFHYIMDNPSSGEFYVRRCKLVASQASTGHIAIIRMQSNTGDVIIENSYLHATSTGGQGYILHKYNSAANGFVRWTDGKLYASYLASNL